MRKSVKEYLIGLVGLVIVMVGFLGGSYIANHYTMTATVKQYYNEVAFVDETGNVWNDDRVENYKLGDTVTITFDTNGTDNTRLDDIVKNIK